jgi:hypothetical protein
MQAGRVSRARWRGDLLRPRRVLLLVNRRLTGVPLIAIGAALNVLAITTNGGVMPANASALRIAASPSAPGSTTRRPCRTPTWPSWAT